MGVEVSLYFSKSGVLMSQTQKVQKVQWIEDGIERTKYELNYDKKKGELEVCEYYYPLLGRGYGNYSAFCLIYNKKDGVLTYTHFSDSWGGSGLHFKKTMKVGQIDIDRIAKEEPKEAFRYLRSFFEDDDFDDEDDESDVVDEEDLIDEEEKKELDEILNEEDEDIDDEEEEELEPDDLDEED